MMKIGGGGLGVQGRQNQRVLGPHAPHKAWGHPVPGVGGVCISTAVIYGEGTRRSQRAGAAAGRGPAVIEPRAKI